MYVNVCRLQCTDPELTWYNVCSVLVFKCVNLPKFKIFIYIRCLNTNILSKHSSNSDFPVNLTKIDNVIYICAVAGRFTFMTQSLLLKLQEAHINRARVKWSTSQGCRRSLSRCGFDEK